MTCSLDIWRFLKPPDFGKLGSNIVQVQLYGYGSIPINTIFRGMNIHLPAILMFTRGTRFWHTAISSQIQPWCVTIPSPVAVTLSFVHNFGESMWHFSSQGNCHSWRPLKNGFGKYWEHIFWWHYMAIFGLHGRLQAIAQGGGPQFPPPNVRSVLAAPEICVSSWLRPAALRHIAPAAGGITT